MKTSNLLLSIAASLILVQANPAFAEWKELGSNELMVVYVDLATITDVGETAQIMSMLDLKKPGVNPSNKKSVSSVIGLNEYNCPGISYRPIAYKEFSGKKGSGKLVSDNQTPNSQFEGIVNDSWQAGVFNVVCQKK